MSVESAKRDEDLELPDEEFTEFGRLVRDVAKRLHAGQTYVHFGADQVDGELSAVVRAVLAEQGQPPDAPTWVSDVRGPESA